MAGGQTGLEEASRTARGRPGRELLAGTRVLAKRVRAKRVRCAPPSTPACRSPRSRLSRAFRRHRRARSPQRRIRALAGIAFSAPQHRLHLQDRHRHRGARAGHREAARRLSRGSAAIVDGVELRTPTASSAGARSGRLRPSCNSVFGPLGVEIGSEGWWRASALAGTRRPPSPARCELHPARNRDRLALEIASTAIGQFRNAATPLMMASVAQTIAARGVRASPRCPRRAHPHGPGDPPQGGPPGRLDDGRGGGLRHGYGGARCPASRWRARPAPPNWRTRATRDGETRPRTPRTPTPVTAYAPAKEPQIVVAVMLVRAGAGLDGRSGRALGAEHGSLDVELEVSVSSPSPSTRAPAAGSRSSGGEVGRAASSLPWARAGRRCPPLGCIPWGRARARR